MKNSILKLFILMLLGGSFVVPAQTNISLAFSENKNQKENIKPELDMLQKEGTSLAPAVQQSQLIDRTNTNQTHPPGDEMSQQISTAADGVPPGYSSELIDVKFREGTDMDPLEEVLPPDLLEAVASICKTFSLSEEELRRIGADQLRFWFRLTLKPDVDSVDFIERLKLLESVEHAEFVPLPPPLPLGN